MRRIPFPLLYLAVWLVGGSPSAQDPGEALDYVKFSETRGGFAGVLSDVDQFGRAVDAIGDLDDNGIVDVIVGAHGSDDGGSADLGSVWILLLDKAIDDTDGPLEVIGEQKISATEGGFTGSLDDDDQFGRAVAGIGDWDGDGVEDVAVGCSEDDDGGTDRGAFYILFMNTDGTVKSHQKISNTEGGFTATLYDGDEFGRAIAPLADMDGDGVGELAVGAAYDSDGGYRKGAFYVLFMNSDGTVKSHQKISDTEGGFEAGTLENGDTLGVDLDGLGDFDGDGIDDLIVGAAGDNDGGEGVPEANAGAVYIVFLNADGTVKSQQKISQQEGNFTEDLDAQDWFGFAVTTIGDLDGNGFPDVAVGAYGNDVPPLADLGALHVLLLSPEGSVLDQETIGQVGAELEGGDWFGASVAGVGDLDGDGVPDLASGARLDGDGGMQHGALYVLFLAGANESTPPFADFSADPMTGEVPLTVDFSDLSRNIIDTRTWDFGEGTTSTEADPMFTYAVPGTYTVSLTVEGPGGVDSIDLSIEAVAPAAPVAAFDASETAGLWPLDVDFTNLSTGLIDTLEWDFGDGTLSTESDPSYTYTTEGTFTVSLTVTNLGGTSVTTLDVVVDAPPVPIASFDADVFLGGAPTIVNFTDLSTGSISSWSWDFGDGGTSTEQNPSYTFETPGTYSVSLTTTGPTGSDTYLGPDSFVILDIPPPPTPDFTATPSTGIAPLAVAFSDTSTGEIDSWFWSFGNGITSRQQNPNYTFLGPGDFTVSLTVSGPNGENTLTRVGFVKVDPPPPPTAAFSAAPTQGVAPHQVTFTDESEGLIDTWAWDFGDGGSAPIKSPRYIYQLPGTYSVSLTVSGLPGEGAMTQESLIVVDAPPAPTPAFAATPTTGVFPLVVDFTDQTLGNVSDWFWDFGDGATSFEQHPTHTYAGPGTYTVSLIATGLGGSADVTLTNLIQATLPPPPVPAFDVVSSQGYVPLTVTFQDLTTGDVSSWHWDFGDGSTSTERDPQHTFVLEGDYSVSLTATGIGGSAQTSANGLITVLPLPDPGLADASFEEAVAGSMPSAWNIIGASHAVLSADLEGQDVLPTHGLQWLDLSAEGSSGAQPPSNPGGETEAPTGGMGVSQAFRYPIGNPILIFDATFLHDGAPASPVFNDWMSVDVTDGSMTWNLFYEDSFSPTVGTSSVHALPMTALRTVRTDLIQLFPGATSDTVFTLTARVGNGGDGLESSHGYLDDFRFGAVKADIQPYGCGINPADSLTWLDGTPGLGEFFTLGIDNPLGTQGAGSVAILAVSFAADANYPCGSSLKNWSMTGPGDSAELLINVSGSFFRNYLGGTWMVPGTPVPVQLFVPNLQSLIGVELFAQGLVYDPDLTFGIENGLTTAYKIVIGP